MTLSSHPPITETESQARERLDRPMPQHRYCEDCKFFVSKTALFYDSDTCSYPRDLTGAQLVRRNTPQPRICATERSYKTEDSCGFAAKWFQPKDGAA